MTSVIRRLDTTLINQIAAGEVIERPASVVKELVENALDAKAQSITITLRNGGKSFIQICDDGMGMNQEDLHLCLERHATSKLPTNDLFHIHTLGFRGEALPSIASISRVRIESFHTSEAHAYEIRVEGGEVHKFQPAKRLKGTCLTVEDLFFATPARLKFLKTDQTEYLQCVEVVKRLALAYPAVGFTLIHDERTVLTYTPGSVESRITDVMGRNFFENSCPVHYANPDRELVITGFIGLPTFNRSNANEQFLYVNNRAVKDKMLTSVFRVAYQDLLESNRHAMGVVFMTLAPQEVDVNAHPAKTEVRFRDGAYIRGALMSTLKNALHSVGGQSAPYLAEKVIARAAPMGYGGGRPGPAYAPQNALPFHPSPRMGAHLADHVNHGAPAHPPPTGEDFPSHDNLEKPLGVPQAQIFNTYIIAQTADGLILVDQHAAHERILFEKLKAQQQGPAPQYLLTPQLITLPPEDVDFIRAHMVHFETLGFIIDCYGDSLAVRAVPASLTDIDLPALFRDFISDLKEHESPLQYTEAFCERLATRACRASIKAGDRLSFEKMDALLRQMEQTNFAAQCNHGRPTFIKLNKNDIEYLFSRR
jgi:DNA mismatch repair protein MutL